MDLRFNPFDSFAECSALLPKFKQLKLMLLLIAVLEPLVVTIEIYI